MYPFKRLMVGLDLSETDNYILDHLSLFCDYIDCEKIYFIHAKKTLDIPDDLREKLPGFEEPLTEKLKKELEITVLKKFGDKNIPYTCEVLEGNPVEKMLRYAHINNIDLFVAGRKIKSKGSGLIARLLVRKLTCSVLVIPEVPAKPIKKILAPVDFSEYSKLAFEEAVALASKINATIVCQYIFQLPSGYYVTGKSEAEFVSILTRHGKTKMEKFLRQIPARGVQIESMVTYDPGRPSEAEIINETAHQIGADLIVVGAKGGNAASLLLLGSVTEKVIQLDTDIPVLVVKIKGKAFGFLDLIKNI